MTTRAPQSEMGYQNDDYHSLEITLTGTNNKTLKGVLNFTSVDVGGPEDESEIYDSKGAATFVIVVILVYGLSIVLMIGSLAKKNMKVKDADMEEKQIHRYLNQANDLREKGAKENYRQLKQNIISIVNRTPDESVETPPARRVSQDFSKNALRSMIAVGSPWAAAVTAVATQAGRESEDEEAAGNGRRRLLSETESLKALLEEDEPDDQGDRTPQTAETIIDPPTPDPPPPPLITPLPKAPVTIGAKLKPTKDIIVTTRASGAQAKTAVMPQVTVRPVPRSKSGLDPQPRPVNGLPQTGNRGIPRVVISNPEEPQPRKPNANLLQPLDIDKAKTGRMPNADRDSKIICNVDGSRINDPGKPCQLSMDAEGNIWIHQSSPDAQRRIPPSPSVSTPGSIGYESLRGPSRSASPSPIPTSSSSPGIQQLQQGYGEYRPPPPPARTSASRSHSPGRNPKVNRTRDHSQSPVPRYGCFDPLQQPIRTLANAGSMNRTPNRTPDPFDAPPIRYPGRMLTSSPKPESRRSVQTRVSVPGYQQHPVSDTDEEELVQITSV